MTQPKIIFLGNCQAQAFESLSGHLGLDITVIPAPPIWQVTDEDEDELSQNIASADFVFSQRLSDEYPVSFVRNELLKERFGSKVVIWPNLYFDGYFPGIRYLYGDSGKIVGPLRDYHFQWIIDGWRRGITIAETTLTASDPAFWAGNLDFVESSLRELHFRESKVDVSISDYIRNNFRRIKLFYSMNHPKTFVLGEMLRRLFSHIDIPYQQANIQSYTYNLDEIVIPNFPIFNQRYWPTFSDGELFKGVKISPQSLKPEDSVEYYNLETITECYYRIYDRFQTDV